MSHLPHGNPWAPSDPWAVPTSPWAWPTLPASAHDRRLDAQVEETRAWPGRWLFAGVAQVLIPVLSIVAVVAIVVIAGLPHEDVMGAVYTVVAQLLAAAMVWFVAKDLARQYGGWRQAFGFGLPRKSDLGQIALWSLLQVVARFAVVIVLAVAFPGLRPHGGNLEGVSQLSPAALLLTGLGAVVLAPVVEELAFRGIVLRGLMRRMPFWPAALISSACFAALHILGVAHLAGIPDLLSTIAVFAVLQCILVRRTGRLGPASAVHATTNLIFLALSVAAGG